MNFERLEVQGNQDLGVYITASQKYALVPQEIENKLKEVIAKTLDVETISSSIEGSSLLGSLTEINSNGIVVSGMITEDEIKKIEETKLEIGFISGNMNASGNLVVSNKNKALIHPDLSKNDVEKIQKTLNVDTLSTKISGIKNVGAAAALNDQGALIHPKTDDKKVKKIEEFLDVPTKTGTVNYGSPMIGSGMVTNNKGFLVGTRTTGHELGRIENSLFEEA